MTSSDNTTWDYIEGTNGPRAINNQYVIGLQPGAKVITLKKETRFVSAYEGKGITQTGITLAAGMKVNYTCRGNAHETWHTAYCTLGGRRYEANCTTAK